MFHQNVYGDMKRKSITSCCTLESEIPESPIQQRELFSFKIDHCIAAISISFLLDHFAVGYDPINPFQPDKTLKRQYSRLNEIVQMTNNEKELEC